jgi:hypothetical protein
VRPRSEIKAVLNHLVCSRAMAPPTIPASWRSCRSSRTLKLTFSRTGSRFTWGRREASTRLPVSSARGRSLNSGRSRPTPSFNTVRASVVPAITMRPKYSRWRSGWQRGRFEGVVRSRRRGLAYVVGVSSQGRCHRLAARPCASGLTASTWASRGVAGTGTVGEVTGSAYHQPAQIFALQSVIAAVHYAVGWGFPRSCD